MNTQAPDRRDEDGMILVFMTVFIVVALALAAFVIDLAALRQDRATNRSASDMAATSAALKLSEGNLTPPARVAACQAAWDYATQNLSVSGTSNCSPLNTACNAAVEQTATAVAGRYTITVTNPVVDAHLSPDTITNSGSQAVDPARDGTPCERVAVQITQIRAFAFAAIVGAHTGTTTSRSIGRAFPGITEGPLAALLILDKTHCNALTSSGQGTIEVKGAGTAAGVIAVDSSATAGGGGTNGCGNNRYALDASTSNNSRILADAGTGGASGQIELWALAAGQGNAHGYDASQVPSNVSPQPSASPMQYTRSVVDNKYNCTTAGNPDCQAGPYVTNLTSTYGSGTPAGTTLTLNGAQCNPSADVTYNSSLVYVNCPSGFSVHNVNVTFNGGDVVFAGGVDVQGGALNVNTTGGSDHIVYLRNGSLTTGSTAKLTMNHTFVYLGNGAIGLLASGPVSWNAPAAGNFQGLALWTETSADQSLKGQASLSLNGVYFTPNAHVQFDGQGAFTQLMAQFIAQTLDMSGQGTLVMTPDPNSKVRLPKPATTLIR